MKCYNAAKKIVQTLHNAGFTAYFNGGWVRDHLLGKDADDIDIATTATPEDMIDLFEKTIPVGINFSILIVVQDEVHCEVATFRKESDYVDGRRPEKVSHTTPEEDAKRRDFTINGMFFDPLTDTIYDYVGGQQDLKKGVIKAIGNPHQRFNEDRLRMIRACRYSARFSFPIEKETKAAIIAHAGELFPAVAIERVYDEFRKMTKDPHLFDALLLLHQFTLLDVIFKDLPLISYNKLEEKLKTPLHFPENTSPIVYLYELLEEISLSDKIALCKHFKVSKSEIRFTEELDKWKHSLDFSDYELVQLYAHENSDKCLKITSIHVKDSSFDRFHAEKKKLLKEHIRRLIEKRPLICSKDLLDRGMKAGRELGNTLKEAEKLAINKNLSTKQEVFQALSNSKDNK
ncbi:MAG: CCA-adding enzyme [Chlamydiia bacterium]|nr:CCA-adding enzyme [Chlamydiia bacterium]MCH9618469.1 CCA-adding enzyme [Chlamydiia bacterium]MCH9623931.1 CCA-adding enzyme [Chlamydiia bacterium]